MNRRVYLLTAVALIFSMFAMASAAMATHKKGSEGCTPGYWRNHVGVGSTTTFESVFGNTAATGTTTTMQQAAAIGGGGLNALVRHAAAAYLNSLNDVDYLYHTADIVAMFQAALTSGDYETTKNLFVTQNELGCPF
jgi:hypothetical protein